MDEPTEDSEPLAKIEVTHKRRIGAAFVDAEIMPSKKAKQDRRSTSEKEEEESEIGRSLSDLGSMADETAEEDDEDQESNGSGHTLRASSEGIQSHTEDLSLEMLGDSETEKEQHEDSDPAQASSDMASVSGKDQSRAESSDENDEEDEDAILLHLAGHHELASFGPPKDIDLDSLAATLIARLSERWNAPVKGKEEPLGIDRSTVGVESNVVAMC